MSQNGELSLDMDDFEDSTSDIPKKPAQDEPASESSGGSSDESEESSEEEEKPAKKPATPEKQKPTPVEKAKPSNKSGEKKEDAGPKGSKTKEEVKESSKSESESEEESSVASGKTSSVASGKTSSESKTASEASKKSFSSQTRDKVEAVLSIPPEKPPEIPLNPEQTAEIERLQAIVREQRTVIDTQKEAVRRLMTETGTHQEIATLRANLACKSPLLQKVAATPMSEQRTVKRLKADNAALRREIDNTEVRHLTELKRMKTLLASLSARSVGGDGCARCKRRLRELEDEKLGLLKELETSSARNV
jgi:hypothetical protein